MSVWYGLVCCIRPRAQSLSAVEQVIVELGLSRCADSRIGGDLVRGISGGEKRRVSVAIQMLTAPNVLYLDEPVS